MSGAKMRHILLPIMIGVIVVLGVALVDLFLRSSPSFLETPIPEREELIAMVAEYEEVPASAITLHVVDDTHEWPYILYSVDPEVLPQPVPVDRLPVNHKAIIHPRAKPWEWILGGGSGSELPRPGVAASLSLSSCRGCSNSDVNTTIYGLAVPEAAEITVGLQGRGSYTRDLRERNGYMILLPYEGVTPEHILDVQVLDEDGNELPAPKGVSQLDSASGLAVSPHKSRTVLQVGNATPSPHAS